jgi:hypothetical protein
MSWLGLWYLAEAIEHDEPTGGKPKDKDFAELLGVSGSDLAQGQHDARDDEMDAGLNPERASNKSK